MRSWALARPRPIAFHEEFEALAKNRYRDIVSICSNTSDCAWHRSKVTSARKFFACLSFRSFYFRIRDGHTKYTKISRYTVLSI
jgi:hypothetical protein